MEEPRTEHGSGPGEERLYGFIERVTFHNPENGYTVLRVRVRGQREPVAVVGNLPSAVPGEMLEASGRWEVSPRHGRQFSAVRLSAVPPGTSEGMKRYLGSGMIRGIGPALASRLV
nr:ATP-dependent RecD-like DNA helicase [bacterium]